MLRKDAPIPTPDEARALSQEFGLDDLSPRGAELFLLISAQAVRSAGKQVTWTVDDWANSWSSALDPEDWGILERALKKSNWTFGHEYCVGGADRSGVDEPNYYQFIISPLELDAP